MTLTPRMRGGFAGRRLVAGIGLAGAAILLPTAALASSSEVTSARATDHAAARTVPACHAASTRVWYGLPAEHATSKAFYELQISNVGRSACTFFGFPGVSALDKNGNQVGRPATTYGHRIGVTLRPGDTAHAVLVVINASVVCNHPVKATQIRVFPPGQFRAQSVPLSSLGCPGKSVLRIDSVHPGAGIPFFSIR